MHCLLSFGIVLGVFKAANNGMAVNVNDSARLIDLTRLAWSSDVAVVGPVTNFFVELSNSCTSKYANHRHVATFLGKKLASLEAILVRIKWHRPNDEVDEATSKNGKCINTVEINDFGADSVLPKEGDEPNESEKVSSQTLLDESAKIEELPLNRTAELHIKNGENVKENAPFIEFDTVSILNDGSEEVGQKRCETELIHCIFFRLRTANSNETFGASFELSHLKDVTLKIGLKPKEVPNTASKILKWIDESKNEEEGQ